MSLGTVASLKDSTQIYQTLFMVAVTLQGTSTPLLLSTHPFDGVSGPAFPGIGVLPAGNYEARLLQQDIEAIQQRSQLGIDRAAKVTIHIIDADREIYNTICKVYGFRGASMVVALCMWQAGTTNFSDDAPVLFTGTCDMEVPQRGGTIVSVSANTGHNTATVKLPLFPIQNRCPLHFPANAAERLMATDPTSTFCPYSYGQPGGIGNLGPSANLANAFGDIITDASSIYIACDYTRSNLPAYQANVNPWDRTWGCMARLGNYATTSVAPDGDLWHDVAGHPTGAFAGIEWSPSQYYGIGVSYTSGKSATFSFLNASILGQYHNLLYGTQWVNCKLANVVETGNDTKSEAMVCTGDVGGTVGGYGVITVTVNGILLSRAPSGDNNIWWDYNNTGARLASGRNTDIGYNGGVSGMSLSDPYGSICCLRTTFYKDIFTGFGTPTIRVLANGPQLYTYNSDGSLNSVKSLDNPAWVLVDLLTRANWSTSEIDMNTVINVADFCATNISYVDQSGNTATHPRFQCKFSLEQRKTAAEIIAAVLRCFNGYLAWGQSSGLLEFHVNQTLADSQSAPVTGSNYNTGITSKHADGTTGTGYAAYLFDESNILRTTEGELDLEFEQNATVTTPNQIFINFQDEDNQYVDDSLGEFDTNAITRAGGSLQPGGSLIPETLNVVGISNFDQAVRIANVYLAERQYGNELNEPIGTRIMSIGTTVKCETLRTGHLVAVSLQMYSMVKQLFRVLKVQPDTDGRTWRLTLQWHEDIWYTDAYGQAPQAFYSSAGLNKPTRPPLPWQPFNYQPVVPSGDLYRTEWGFSISEVDNIGANGLINVQLRVDGVLPVNQIASAMQQPRAPIQATSLTTGGTIPGGVTYLIELCAIDSSGNYSPHSGPVTVQIPATTNTNTITISNIGWPLGANGYTVFAGVDHYNITQQFTTTGSAPSNTVTLTSFPNQLAFAPPDLASGTMEVKGKLVIHEGIIGETVAAVSGGSHTITLGAQSAGSGTLSDLTVGGTVVRKLILIGRPNYQNNEIPIVEFNILSNTGGVPGVSGPVITVDRDPTTGSPANILVGDVVVISSQANISSATTIGDTQFMNPYGPSGVGSEDAQYMIMITRGTGRYQQRLITAVSSGTTYTVDHPFSIVPDATSMFIVVEKTWRYISEVSSVNNAAYNSAKVSLLNIDNYLQKPVLVMALVGDQQGVLFASEFRSPFRIIYSFGVQGTRTVYSSDTQQPTDGLVLCDTSGLTGTTTTLVSTIDAVVTSLDLTSSTGVMVGVYIQIGTEAMYVIGGSAPTWDVDRGSLGTTAASHTGGATVDIPTSLAFQLLPLVDLPNQQLEIAKVSSDLNYVSVLTDSSDTFPDGSTTHIIPDDSAGLGVFVIKAPG